MFIYIKKGLKEHASRITRNTHVSINMDKDFSRSR